MLFIHLPVKVKVWHYNIASSECIRRAISILAEKKQAVLNIIWNFIPDGTVTFDDSDPLYISSCIKKMINNKSLAIKFCE